MVGVLFVEVDGGFGGVGFDIVVVFECFGCGFVVELFFGVLFVGCVLLFVGGDVYCDWFVVLIDGSVSVVFVYDELGLYYELMIVCMCVEWFGDGWVLIGVKGVVD